MPNEPSGKRHAASRTLARRHSIRSTDPALRHDLVAGADRKRLGLRTWLGGTLPLELHRIGHSGTVVMPLALGAVLVSAGFL